jgi:hypothetical protein
MKKVKIEADDALKEYTKVLNELENTKWKFGN